MANWCKNVLKVSGENSEKFIDKFVKSGFNAFVPVPPKNYDLAFQKWGTPMEAEDVKKVSSDTVEFKTLNEPPIPFLQHVSRELNLNFELTSIDPNRFAKSFIVEKGKVEETNFFDEFRKSLEDSSIKVQKRKAKLKN